MLKFHNNGINKKNNNSVINNFYHNRNIQKKLINKLPLGRIQHHTKCGTVVDNASVIQSSVVINAHIEDIIAAIKSSMNYKSKFFLAKFPRKNLYP